MVFKIFREKSTPKRRKLSSIKNERKSIPISTDDVQISYRKKMIQKLEKNKFDFIDKYTKNMVSGVLKCYNFRETMNFIKKHLTLY